MSEPTVARFERPPTALKAVADELRSRILFGQLAPGTPLSQVQIASDLGVSRAIVREATRVLEGEGRISQRRQEGYFVAGIALDQVDEIFQVRELLEGVVAKIVMGNPTIDLVERLSALNDSMLNSSPIQQVRINREFHFALITPAQTPIIEKIIGDLWDATDPYRRTYFTQPGLMNESCKSHREIIKAVESGSSAAVVRALKGHRDDAIGSLKSTIKSMSQS